MTDHSTNTSALKHLKACGKSGLNSIRGFEVGELLKGHTNLIDIMDPIHHQCYLSMLARKLKDIFDRAVDFPKIPEYWIFQRYQSDRVNL